MSGTRLKVLSLYKNLIRESRKFNSYNYRMYAIRKTRDEFRSNQKVSDPSVIEQLIKKAEDNLELIKRQVLIGHMYGEGHLIIENFPKKSQK